MGFFLPQFLHMYQFINDENSPVPCNNEQLRISVESGRTHKQDFHPGDQSLHPQCHQSFPKANHVIFVPKSIQMSPILWLKLAKVS